MADLVQSEIFDRLPERYQRRAREIAARVAEINQLLNRCDIGAIVDAASRLQGQLRWQPETDHEAFGAEFKAACQDLPEWAISEATNDYLAGRVENHTGQFMPTCAEFARHAREIIRPFIAERAGLRNEAERLFTRAEDDRRRELIAIERSDPGVKDRVRQMVSRARAGAPVLSSDHRHAGITDETRAKLQTLKKSRTDEPTRLLETRIVKGKAR